MTESHLKIQTQATLIQSTVRMAKIKLVLQVIDKGHRIQIEPLTDNNISPRDLIPCQNRCKQKQFEKTKSLAASSALLNDIDVQSDDDDIFDKRIPTTKELNYIQSELKKSTEY